MDISVAAKIASCIVVHHVWTRAFHAYVKEIIIAIVHEIRCIPIWMIKVVGRPYIIAVCAKGSARPVDEIGFSVMSARRMDRHEDWLYRLRATEFNNPSNSLVNVQCHNGHVSTIYLIAPERS